jgi:MbtH protein
VGCVAATRWASSVDRRRPSTSDDARAAPDLVDDREVICQVVVNDEEQYSIWPVGRQLPAGWSAEGTTGPKEYCLSHIDEVWRDMRPLSLRRQMAEARADHPVPGSGS